MNELGNTSLVKKTLDQESQDLYLFPLLPFTGLETDSLLNLSQPIAPAQPILRITVRPK